MDYKFLQLNALDPTTKQYYELLYSKILQASPTGKIEGAAAVKFLQLSGVDLKILKEIWSLSSVFKQPNLQQLEFFLALKYISLAQKGLFSNPLTGEAGGNYSFSMLQQHHQSLDLPHFQGIPRPQVAKQEDAFGDFGDGGFNRQQSMNPFDEVVGPSSSSKPQDDGFGDFGSSSFSNPKPQQQPEISSAQKRAHLIDEAFDEILKPKPPAPQKEINIPIDQRDPSSAQQARPPAYGGSQYPGGQQPNVVVTNVNINQTNNLISHQQPGGSMAGMGGLLTNPTNLINSTLSQVPGGQAGVQPQQAAYQQQSSLYAQAQPNQPDPFANLVGDLKKKKEEPKKKPSDDWGDFGEVNEAPEKQDDGFGDFGGDGFEDFEGETKKVSAPAFKPLPFQPNQPVKEDDLFADSFPSQQQTTQHQTQKMKPVENPPADDGFAEFDDALGEYFSPSKASQPVSAVPAQAPKPAQNTLVDPFANLLDTPAASSQQAPPQTTGGDNGFADFEDGFGNFECTPAQTPSKPAPTQTPSQSADDGFADFGDFESAKPADPFPPASSALKDDGFGDFGGAPSSVPAQSSAAAPSTTLVDDDGFADFAGFQDAPKPAAEPAPKVEDDGFGDFGGFSEPAKEQPKVEDDGFGDFGGGFEEPAAADAKKEDDGFGNFDETPSGSTSAAPMTEQITTTKVEEKKPAGFVPQKAAVGDDDPFKDILGEMGIETKTQAMPTFSMDAPAKPEEKPVVSSSNDWMSAMNTQAKSTTTAAAPSKPSQPEKEEDDGFGDFGDDGFGAEDNKPEADWMTPSAPAQAKAEPPKEDDDGFGDFGGGFEEPAKPETAKQAAVVENDGFADFAKEPSSKVEDDGFGDFGGFGDAKPEEDDDPVIEDVDYTGKVDEAAEQEEFGDFLDGENAVEEVIIVEKKVADINEDMILSGFMNEFGTSKPEQPRRGSEVTGGRDEIRIISEKSEPEAADGFEMHTAPPRQQSINLPTYERLASKIEEAFSQDPNISEIRALVQANDGNLFEGDFLQTNRSQLEHLMAFEEQDSSLIAQFLASKDKLVDLEKEKKKAVMEEDFEQALALKKDITATQTQKAEIETSLKALLCSSNASARLSDRQVFEHILKFEDSLKSKHAHQVSRFAITEHLLKTKEERRAISQFEIQAITALAVSTKISFAEGCEQFLATFNKIAAKLTADITTFHRVLSEFTEVLEMGFDTDAEEKANQELLEKAFENPKMIFFVKGQLALRQIAVVLEEAISLPLMFALDSVLEQQHDLKEASSQVRSILGQLNTSIDAFKKMHPLMSSKYDELEIEEFSLLSTLDNSDPFISEDAIANLRATPAAAQEIKETFTALSQGSSLDTFENPACSVTQIPLVLMTGGATPSILTRFFAKC